MAPRPRSEAGTAISRRVSRNVDQLRKSRGLTHDQLAQKVTAAGYPIATRVMARIVKGAYPNGTPRPVTVDELAAIAAALGVPAAQLLNGPACDTCLDTPPPGFACTDCGATTPKENRP